MLKTALMVGGLVFLGALNTAFAGEAVGTVSAVRGRAWVTPAGANAATGAQRILLEAKLESLLFDQSGSNQHVITNLLEAPVTTTLSPASKPLLVGDKIAMNDELATDERGGLEFTFLDGSRMTMGANSKLVVDEYVYLGPVVAGRPTTKYAKGLFRFVRGSIPKDQVRIETPTITIGIRG